MWQHDQGQRIFAPSRRRPAAWLDAHPGPSVPDRPLEEAKAGACPERWYMLKPSACMRRLCHAAWRFSPPPTTPARGSRGSGAPQAEHRDRILREVEHTRKVDAIGPDSESCMPPLELLQRLPEHSLGEGPLALEQPQHGARPHHPPSAVRLRHLVRIVCVLHPGRAGAGPLSVHRLQQRSDSHGAPPEVGDRHAHAELFP
mmetsp:Transcript_14724/g.42412  ORF Transcript_14724/g.42412 Transcript_14724/m.42412 type:complete len:201 (-) Transcript_14724:741-1343(-)